MFNPFNIVCLLFSFIFVFMFAGCGGKANSGDADQGELFNEDEIEEVDSDTFEKVFDGGEPDFGEITEPDGAEQWIDMDCVELVEEEPADFTYPPYLWGPYCVGVRSMRKYFGDYSRWINIMVWYPAVCPSPSSRHYKYMWLLEGNAYEDIAADSSSAPYPIILFSHGNKGINFQSFSLTEYLASHGFIVAAPNHPGNTMYDSPSDEQMALIALERPDDIAFTYDKIVEANRNPDDRFYSMVDEWSVGMLGHSFGGYTSLVISGASIDVDAAKDRCSSGEIESIFCDYINVWPSGEVITRPPQMWVVGAGIALAPGGYQAFYDEGLATVNVPVMVFGGTLDEWCSLEEETRPIYSGLPPPAYKIEIDGAGHMSFTDICRIPGSMLIPELADMCDPSRYIDLDRAFEITNTFCTAFFRYYMLGEETLRTYLESEFASTFYPEVDFAFK